MKTLTLLLIFGGRLAGQGITCAAPACFSIIYVNDPHYLATDSVGGPGRTLDIIAPWVATNQSALNIQAFLVGGDVTSQYFHTSPSDFTGGSGVLGAVPNFQSIANLGIITLIGDGNHDFDPSLSTCAAWNASGIPAINAANALYASSSQYFGTHSCTGVLDSDLYQKLDVPTSIGTVHLGIGVSNLYGTSDVTNTTGDLPNVFGWMTADPNRQNIFVTHAFQMAQSATVTSGVCGSGHCGNPPYLLNSPFFNNYSGYTNVCGMTGTYGCLPNNPTDPYTGTHETSGNYMWANFLSKDPNLIMVLSGHFHMRSELSLTGNSGNSVIAWMNDQAGDNSKGYITILKFRPADGAIDLVPWNVKDGIVDNAAWANGPGPGAVTFSWSPMFTIQSSSVMSGNAGGGVIIH